MDNEGHADPQPVSNMIQELVNPSLTLTVTISQICYNAKTLLNFIPPIVSAIKEVRDAKEQLTTDLVNIKATSDFNVKKKLTDLQLEYRTFLVVSKGFLKSCKWMAMYATNKNQLLKIERELTDESLGELNKYLDSLSSYLEACEVAYKKYEEIHKRMAHQVKSATEHISSPLPKIQENSEDSQNKFEKAVVDYHICAGLPYVCVLIVSVSVNVVALHLHWGIALCLSGLILLFLARMIEGKGVLNVMKQERVRKNTAIREKIHLDALNCVSKLDSLVSDTVSIIQKMKYNSDCASGIINARGLKVHSKSVPEDIDFFDLKLKVKMLQDYIGEIVTEIGEDGIRPISTNPDELVSDKRPYQETDRHETPLVDTMMNTLSLTTRVNGNPSNESEIAAPASDQQIGVSQLVAGSTQEDN